MGTLAGLGSLHKIRFHFLLIDDNGERDLRQRTEGLDSLEVMLHFLSEGDLLRELSLLPAVDDDGGIDHIVSLCSTISVIASRKMKRTKYLPQTDE